ncbi:MAG: cytochrome c3 family protein [Planctomycetota bacterium]
MEPVHSSQTVGTPHRRPRFRRSRVILASVLGLAIWVACGALVAPQDWNKGRGPVVPHDTFPADCRLCHEGSGWNHIRADFRFDHLKETGVALDGAHQQAECLRCHNDRGPVKDFASRGCAGCHVDPHRTQLGVNCRSCHDERTWVPIGQVAKHASTRFPLVGSHASVGCFACHPGAEVGNFEGLDPQCETCHTKDLPRATNPDHRTLGWTTDCQRCHVPIDFQRARFDHPASFPLSGGHSGIRCATCHGDNSVFTGLSTACTSCHQDEFDRTTDPNHVGAVFSSDCLQCHSITTWNNTHYVHPGSFALTGGHAGRRCSACHGTSGTYTSLDTNCVSCHQADYDRVTDPNHVTAGFPQDCTQCHTTTRWSGARFDHPASFPLTGGHSGHRCADCHGTSGVYTGLDTACVSCHRADFDGTRDPNHQTAGFSTDCTQCHTTTRWQGATFNHPASFPLTGGHANHTCADCHGTGGNYAGLSTACDSCHHAAYVATTNPNHQSASFPLTCQTCHNTTQWLGATFNHSFPITSGAHRGFTCADCHTTPNNYQAFSCIDCHTHSRTTTDGHHRGVRNYVYASPDCLRCHPNGRH